MWLLSQQPQKATLSVEEGAGEAQANRERKGMQGMGKGENCRSTATSLRLPGQRCPLAFDPISKNRTHHSQTERLSRNPLLRSVRRVFQLVAVVTTSDFFHLHGLQHRPLPTPATLSHRPIKHSTAFAPQIAEGSPTAVPFGETAHCRVHGINSPPQSRNTKKPSFRPLK